MLWPPHTGGASFERRAQVTSDYLRWWGRQAYCSPLYRTLAEFVAQDPDLLRVVSSIENLPEPNLLFASVQYLLMRQSTDRLREYYASLVDDPRPPDGATGPFKAFVLDNEALIVELGRTRYTQTNECKRCIALLPAVWATGLPRFHIIEIGASAGLNLAMDRYRYRWGDTEWGPPSEVTLVAESRGGRVRPAEIEILSRTGLDLDPVDVEDPDQRDWLIALIWPEHHERRARLRRALRVVTEVSIDMVPGDATETLSGVLSRLPEGDPAIVMNSMALMQFSRTQRDSLYEAIERENRRRPLRRVSFELLAAGDEWVTLSADLGAGLAQIGQADAHGEWLDLYARP